MGRLATWKHRALSSVVRDVPGLVRPWAQHREFVSHAAIPWTPLRKPITACRVALVTTAGVHLRTQPPFDMQNPLGEASCRDLPEK
jgi:D-proline reductase (dithiol) PrdB